MYTELADEDVSRVLQLDTLVRVLNTVRSMNVVNHLLDVVNVLTRVKKVCLFLLQFYYF
jgi:hypothetical protein